jgi:hypothetical protein
MENQVAATVFAVAGAVGALTLNGAVGRLALSCRYAGVFSLSRKLSSITGVIMPEVSHSHWRF